MDPRCEQALENLWPLGEPGRGDSAELAAAARRHIEECGACQEFLCRDRTLQRRLREIRPGSSADCFPEEARTTLLAHLAGREPGVRAIESARSRRLPAWFEAAIGTAAAVVLLASGLVFSSSAQSPVPDNAFARDYTLAALPQLVSTELTPSQVAAFYERQFGDVMEPAALLAAPVRRVAVCDVDGRRGAMVEYDFEGERLVYYQLPLEGMEGTKLRTGREGSLNMARWGDAESEHVIVSEMPADTLMSIARARMN